MKRLFQQQSILNAIPYLLLGIILIGQFIAIYLLNGGKFIYILDDPYIHLALARNIYHGHYGINLVEPSAPSSSILWPFILAPFAPLPFFEYIPLIINLIFGFLTIFFIHKTIKLIFQDIISIGQKVFLTSSFVILANITPLVFSGMEHIFQVLLTSIILYNVLELQINNTLNKSLIIAIILNPLVRYETLAISIPVLLFLYLKSYRRLAIIGLFLTILPLIAFSLFLHSLGLGYLPTSVIIKSARFSNRSSIGILFQNIGSSMSQLTWFYLLSMLVVFGIKLRNKFPNPLLLTTIIAITLQLVFGTTLGSFYRYETYMIVYSTLVCLYIYRENIPIIFISNRKLLITFLINLLFFSVFNYTFNIIYTPMMSNNIYIQQYQTSRFINNYYQGNVGVNDIGVVSFSNPNYTLDLFGLSNINVIDYRKSKNPLWMDQISDQYDVDLVIIYDEWFRNFIPSKWVKLGELHLSTQLVSAAHRDVVFYVRNPDQAEAVRQMLKQFSQTLPKGAEFRFAQQ